MDVSIARMIGFRRDWLVWEWSLILAVACGAGCSGSRGGGSVVVAKDLVPADVAKRAMELYDGNKDGKLDAQELQKSPALQDALARADANKDKSISEDEIAARIQAYQRQSDLVPLSVQLTSDRRPVSNAEVVFEPEPFMGENLPSFKGISDATGNVALANEQINLPGVPLGFYRVRVSGPTSAELGCEVAEDSPTGTRITLSF